MRGLDAAAIALWAVTIAVTAALGWEPWRRTRRRSGVLVSNGAWGSKTVSPLYAFSIPAMWFVVGGAFIAINGASQLGFRAFELIVWSVGALLGQLWVRRAFFRFLERQHQAREKGWLTPDGSP